MTKRMTDEEAFEFYNDPANRQPDPNGRIVRRKPLGDSIPVRFPTSTLEQIRTVADADGVTVSEWVRQAVADALTQRDRDTGDPTTVARELERLARKLRRSA